MNQTKIRCESWRGGGGMGECGEQAQEKVCLWEWGNRQWGGLWDVSGRSSGDIWERWQKRTWVGIESGVMSEEGNLGVDTETTLVLSSSTS